MRRATLACVLMTLVALVNSTLTASPALAQVSFTLGKPTSEATARETLRQLTAGEFEAVFARFSPEMQGALPLDQLPTLWGRVTQQAGALRVAGAADIRKTGGGDVIDLACRFEHADLLVEMVVTPEGKISGFHIKPPKPRPWTAPAYVDTTRFEERPIVLPGGGVPLPGLLTVPLHRTGPVAAVLLLAGSGPEDRDESIGPNKVLRDVAQGLASRGIASLRYDKRTLVAGHTMKAATITIEEEVLADADSALALLRRMPDVDPARIFVLGHSLSASLAPVIAERNHSLRGIVMLAASARPILRLVSDQFHYLSTIETDSTRAAALDSLSRAAVTFEDPSLPDSTVFMGITLHYQRDLDARRPLEVAQKLDLPMLIVQGGRDYQVTMADFDRWQAALGPKEHVTFRLFNELNHLMIPGEGAPSPKEYEVPSHVDSRVIDEVVTFVQGQ